jgi:hypothetical protein
MPATRTRPRQDREHNTGRMARPIGSLSATFHDREAVVIMSTSDAAQPATEPGSLLAGARAQAAAACARSQEMQQRTSRVLAEAQAARRAAAEARRRRRSSPAGRDLMQRSEHERLLARLESMPVIEQAKGILMAQSARIGHDQASGQWLSHQPRRTLGT